ncbi:hypothetical protein [Microbaculum marinum]|uniref:Uncharacterized protein n=1 Tax=Microbaculum marinum TaxID=1764581 RepID=A0AAW9RTA5_9HYPH
MYRIFFGPRMAALAFAAAASSCAPPPSPPSPIQLSPVTLSAKQVAIVQSDTRKRLKDPESARFGVFAAGADQNGQISVCGYLNAKNSFGGYIGEKPFAGTLTSEGFFLIGFGDNDNDLAAVTAFCRRRSLML